MCFCSNSPSKIALWRKSCIGNLMLFCLPHGRDCELNVDDSAVFRRVFGVYANANSVSINGFKPARAVIAQLSISGSSFAK